MINKNPFPIELNDLNKKYKKKIVIFLDIMGIKSYTKSATAEELCKVYLIWENISKNLIKDEVLKNFAKFTDETTYNLEIDVKDLDLNISVLSDSLVMSFSKKYIIFLPWLLRIPRVLQIYLLSKGLLSRGVVIYDKIYQSKEKSIIFGKGHC